MKRERERANSITSPSSLEHTPFASLHPSIIHIAVIIIALLRYGHELKHWFGCLRMASAHALHIDGMFCVWIAKPQVRRCCYVQEYSSSISTLNFWLKKYIFSTTFVEGVHVHERNNIAGSVRLIIKKCRLTRRFRPSNKFHNQKNMFRDFVM